MYSSSNIFRTHPQYPTNYNKSVRYLFLFFLSLFHKDRKVHNALMFMSLWLHLCVCLSLTVHWQWSSYHWQLFCYHTLYNYLPLITTILWSCKHLKGYLNLYHFTNSPNILCGDGYEIYATSFMVILFKWRMHSIWNIYLFISLQQIV
jgi:hypothetical protein